SEGSPEPRPALGRVAPGACAGSRGRAGARCRGRKDGPGARHHGRRDLCALPLGGAPADPFHRGLLFLLPRRRSPLRAPTPQGVPREPPSRSAGGRSNLSTWVASRRLWATRPISGAGRVARDRIPDRSRRSRLPDLSPSDVVEFTGLLGTADLRRDEERRAAGRRGNPQRGGASRGRRLPRHYDRGADRRLRVARIATLQGELPATHPRAHLATRTILSAAQVARYNELRRLHSRPGHSPRPATHALRGGGQVVACGVVTHAEVAGDATTTSSVPILARR